MDSPRRILIVDDDQDFLIAMRMQFRGRYGILTANSIAEGLSILKEQDVDLVLLDVGLEGENGLDGIKKIHSIHPQVGVAMLSGRKDVKTVVQAIRAGAIEYLTKPINEDELEAVIEKSVATRSVQEKCEALIQTHTNPKNANYTIVYESKIMTSLINQTNNLKGHDANVLIIGETGTGKELLARHIHHQEQNKKRPFIVVNCAAIPENLLESELFGHEAGAFTGASRRRIGKFELADGGDIFLDEISTMKLELQVKLLRVLQEKEFYRLGSNTPIKANFRVIAACNQSLEELVEKGDFRSDLYHRLRILQLTLPPLKNRKEDIPLLTKYFLEKFSNKNNKKEITEDALSKLTEYSWPGNVRELGNVVQSLVIMSKNDIIDNSAFPNWVLNGNNTNRLNNLPNFYENKLLNMETSNTKNTLKEYVKIAEKQCIEHTLQKFNGDKSKAASSLGICRTTFYIKLKELGMMK